MKARGIIGKRIVRIEQTRGNARGRGRDLVLHVTALVLEDGTRLEPRTIETDFGDYWHDFGVVSPPPCGLARDHAGEHKP